MNFKCKVVVNHPMGSPVPQELDNLIREGQNYDPIGSHIVQLKEYYHTLNGYLCSKKEGSKKNLEQYLEAKKRKELLKKSGGKIIKPVKKPPPKPEPPPKVVKRARPRRRTTTGRRRRRRKKVPPKPEPEPPPPKKLDFPVPEFPKHYPFSEASKAPSEDKCKIIVKYKGVMSKQQVKEKRMLFIKNVLAQTGYYVEGTKDDEVLVEYLADILDDFLQKFANLLTSIKNSDPFKNDDDDLLSPLETTLRRFGIRGISALHIFYYENVVKKHDALLKMCTDLYAQYQNTEDECSKTVKK